MLELQEKLLDKMIEISYGYEYHHGVYFFCSWDGDWFHVDGIDLLPFLRENLKAYAEEEGDEEVLQLLGQEEEYVDDCWLPGEDTLDDYFGQGEY